jgi:succinoglycan biosynthesis transport protein ExoP
MLNRPQLQVSEVLDEGDIPVRGMQNPLSGFDILGALRRQLWVLIGAVVVGLLLGIGYLAQAVPTYTSSVSILIDAKKVGMTASTPLEGSLTFETGAIDSQLQILMSDRLASSVATHLGLQNNVDFLDPKGSALSEAIGRIAGAPRAAVKFFSADAPALEVMDLPEPLRLQIAANILQNNLKVSRVGRTYVFTLSYENGSPALAQTIAGQYANAYLEDQLDSKFDSTRRATNWMEERIRDLKAQSLAADEAVQQYRASNNLVAASGRLIDEQSLTDATTQLTAARGALDTASARYQRLKEIIDNQDLNASLTEALENPNVAQLRSRYLEAAKLESEISARYGPEHMAADKARKDMGEYTRLIFAELTNLLPGYQSDVSIAQARVTSIQNTISGFRETSATNDTAMVKLRSLEQESDSLKMLYSTFLQKSQELQQQQSFPITDARIISDASAPMAPSSPKKMLALFASVILGGIVGGAAGGLREWRDRGFRTASQIRDELGLEFIANIPELKKDDLARRKIAPLSPNPQPRTSTADNARRLIVTENPVLQKSVDEPFSQFAEAIRALRFKIGLEFPKRKGIVIGMVSIFPDEGKSTIAKNLASSLALQGTNTLLIDGDLRNPSLTGNLVKAPKSGLIEGILGQSNPLEALSYEHETGLAFLPSGARRRAAHDFFGSSRAHELIEHLRRQYEMTIIDFPPVGALTDAMAANSVIDGYVLVTHWGKTPRKVVKEFVVNHPELADKIVGVVLNKVDLEQLGRYGYHQSGSHYAKYSEKYFSSAANDSK